MISVLPTRMQPGPNESLHGYAARLSHLTDVPLGTVLEQLGLFPGDRLGWGCLLSDPHLEDVAHALDLPQGAVEKMTLRAYEHLLHPPRPEQWRSLGGWAATEWVLLQGGRFCPACLAQHGQWKLCWRLPELFGCLEHNLLLAHECAGCLSPPNRGGNSRAEVGFLDWVHHPNYCFSPAREGDRGTGRGATPCGHDLTSIATRPLTTAERELATVVTHLHAGEQVVLAGEARGPRKARQLLREAFALEMHRTVKSSDVRKFAGARWYRTPQPSAAWTSTLLLRSHDWLLAADPDRTLQLLREWLHRPAAPPQTLSTVRTQLGLEPVLGSLLELALGRPSQPALQPRRPATIHGNVSAEQPCPSQVPGSVDGQEAPPRRTSSTGRTCQAATPACGNDHYGRGVCHAHHMRAFRNPALWDIPLAQWPSLDEPVRPPAPPKSVGPCQATADCAKAAKARKVCSAHYEAARHNPTLWTVPLGSWPPLHAKGMAASCQAGPADAPCGRPPRSLGLCNSHHQRARQHPELWTVPLEQWPPLPSRDRTTAKESGPGTPHEIKGEGDGSDPIAEEAHGDAKRIEEASP